MRSVGILGLALVSVLAIPASADAQRCAGYASFSSGNLRATAGVATQESWRSYGADLTLGRDHGAFVSGGLSYGKSRLSDISSNGIGAAVGYQVDVGTRVQLCPKLQVGHASSVMYAGRTRIDWGSTTTGFSTMAGATAWSSVSFDFVPSAELGYYVASAHQSLSTYGVKDGMTANERYGGLYLSPGLVFQKSVSLSPSVGFPIGVKGGHVVYGVGLAFNFGPKR